MTGTADAPDAPARPFPERIPEAIRDLTARVREHPTCAGGAMMTGTVLGLLAARWLRAVSDGTGWHETGVAALLQGVRAHAPRDPGGVPLTGFALPDPTAAAEALDGEVDRILARAGAPFEARPAIAAYALLALHQEASEEERRRIGACLGLALDASIGGLRSVPATPSAAAAEAGCAVVRAIRAGTAREAGRALGLCLAAGAARLPQPAPVLAVLLDLAGPDPGGVPGAWRPPPAVVHAAEDAADLAAQGGPPAVEAFAASVLPLIVRDAVEARPAAERALFALGLREGAAAGPPAALPPEGEADARLAAFVESLLSDVAARASGRGEAERIALCAAFLHRFALACAPGHDIAAWLAEAEILRAPTLDLESFPRMHRVADPAALDAVHAAAVTAVLGGEGGSGVLLTAARVAHRLHDILELPRAGFAGHAVHVATVAAAFHRAIPKLHRPLVVGIAQWLLDADHGHIDPEMLLGMMPRPQDPATTDPERLGRELDLVVRDAARLLAGRPPAQSALALAAAAAEVLRASGAPDGMDGLSLALRDRPANLPARHRHACAWSGDGDASLDGVLAARSIRLGRTFAGQVRLRVLAVASSDRDLGRGALAEAALVLACAVRGTAPERLLAFLARTLDTS